MTNPVGAPARTLAELTYDECMHLLADQAVGRVAYTVGALPAITPVNYVVDGHAIVFRTETGSRLAAATHDAVVAFEVDCVDPSVTDPWSVVVVGVARAVEDESELLRAQQLGLTSWVEGSKSHYVRVVPASVHGRRLVTPAA